MVISMKKLAVLLCIIIIIFCSCKSESPAEIVTTTLPLYEFTSRLCEGTDLAVAQLITENVSCLHDYTLKPDQAQSIEKAQMVIINGAGLEDFMEDALVAASYVVNSSEGIACADSHSQGHGHTHEEDPHIWLSPEHAKHMAQNICTALCSRYPQYSTIFTQNLDLLITDLNALQVYGESKLSTLSCRKLITFHDGFSYLADSFHLEILHSIEEESGAEASAAELIGIINLVEDNHLSAIFTEINGSVSAANIISKETGVKIYTLDMGMSGKGYFSAMYHNIDTIWEALQ